ncbi:MAG: hypothetical protein RI932_138, partial [Pseudomonadota bacterium]
HAVAQTSGQAPMHHLQNPPQNFSPSLKTTSWKQKEGSVLQPDGIGLSTSENGGTRQNRWRE